MRACRSGPSQVRRATRQWSTMQGAWSHTESGGLSIQGPMFSLGISHKLTGAWRLGAFGFYDPLKLQATHDERPLQTLFSPETPIQLPVAARFSNMDGRSTDYGAGVFIARAQHSAWLGEYEWTAGVLWQRIELRDYRLDYEILEGPQRGVTGQIDFDTDYTLHCAVCRCATAAHSGPLDDIAALAARCAAAAQSSCRSHHRPGIRPAW